MQMRSRSLGFIWGKELILDEAWEDTYIVVFFVDGELDYRRFSNNPEAAQFLEDLVNDSRGEFDVSAHSLVIKTEENHYSILDIEATKRVTVRVGGY